MMLGSCKDVESAEIPLQLENIASKICSTNNHEEFTLIDPKEGINWLETNCNEAFKLLNDFLKKHYHRSYKEVREKIFGIFIELKLADHFK